MARDDTKVNYYSGWDIDQLVATNTVAVSSGITAIYTVPVHLPAIPEYEVQFQPSGSTKWYKAGVYATANTVATLHGFSTYVNGGVIYINTDASGVARYFVWADRIDN